MAKAAKPTRTIYRNSETGQITTKKFAEKNPGSTEKEKIKLPPRKKQ
jgi:hypothetical protein